MSIGRKAIIDTSVLISLYHLDLLNNLNLLYKEVRVPTEVQREFLEGIGDLIEQSKRLDYLLNFYEINHSWFFRCNEYGSDLVEIYRSDKKLDKGEAEAFAQNQVLGSVYDLLLDERIGRKLAKNLRISHHGVLYILANFDLRYKICSYTNSVENLLRHGIGRFSENVVSDVYNFVYTSIQLGNTDW